VFLRVLGHVREVAVGEKGASLKREYCAFPVTRTIVEVMALGRYWPTYKEAVATKGLSADEAHARDNEPDMYIVCTYIEMRLTLTVDMGELWDGVAPVIQGQGFHLIGYLNICIKHSVHHYN